LIYFGQQKKVGFVKGLSQKHQAKQWVSLMFNPYFHTQNILTVFLSDEKSFILRES